MSQAPIAEHAWDALHRHVLVPFAPRCVDQEYGGFLVDFDDRWRPAGPQDKSLEHAARTTMAFALIELAMPGRGYERFVQHGCAFLQQAMWDEAHGGFFARVDRTGRPLWDGLKHPHAVTYVARAFQLAAHLPPGDGLRWAERALAWLEDVAWDPVYGGYWGSFRCDNSRYADGTRLPTPDGRDIFGMVPGFKEINTQGDAIELLAYWTGPDPGGRRAARLQAMVELVTDRLIQPGGVLPYRYLPDWRPAPDLLRVGYQFIMARHLLIPAVRARWPIAAERARALVDFVLASAEHPAGGFSFAVTADGRAWPATGMFTDLRQWWVQLEAIYSLHLFANDKALDPILRARYRAARDTQWAFVRDALFDKQNGGIREVPRTQAALGRLERWLRRLPPHVPPLKTHCWKDISHEVGTFLALASQDTGAKPRGEPL